MAETLDIKNFPDHPVHDDDRILMTDAWEGHAAGSMTVGNLKKDILLPLIVSNSLSHMVLSSAEYEALGEKDADTFYIISENGRLTGSYIGSFPLTTGEILFRTDNEGYWQLSKDGGKTYAWLLDPDGRKVSARGSADVASLGDLTNVSSDVDTAEDGVLLVKEGSLFVPKSPVVSSVADLKNILVPVYDRDREEWIFIPGEAFENAASPLPSGFPYVLPLTLA